MYKIEPAVTTQEQDSEVMIFSFMKALIHCSMTFKKINQLLGISRTENKTEHHCTTLSIYSSAVF